MVLLAAVLAGAIAPGRGRESLTFAEERAIVAFLRTLSDGYQP